MVYRLDRPAIGEECRLSITTRLHVERLRGQLAVTRQINGCRGRNQCSQAVMAMRRLDVGHAAVASTGEHSEGVAVARGVGGSAASPTAT